MLYDPKSVNISIFIKRAHQIADIHGNSAVLRQLPLCMQGEAMEWYASLSSYTTTSMVNSLDSWEVQLQHRFQKDWLEIQEKADKLQF